MVANLYPKYMYILYIFNADVSAWKIIVTMVRVSLGTRWSFEVRFRI